MNPLIVVMIVGGPQMHTDLPKTAPPDAVMASHAQVQEMKAWADDAFLGKAPTRVELKLLRQDHSVLRFRRSCMETPLKLGDHMFKHGLGTHAVSDIEVAIPNGATAFEATVGVDNNYDTVGQRGSVEFVVEVDGKQARRTPVLKASSKPVDVAVPLTGAKTMRLKVTDGGDGPGFDQSDWADARFVVGGKPVYLDDGYPDLVFLGAEPPFSFTYGGQPSSSFLAKWKRSVSGDIVTWDDPDTGLRVSVALRTFSEYPAADWVLSFENRGSKDTPIIENIQALDLPLASGVQARPVVLDRLIGDDCSETSFLPVSEALVPAKRLGIVAEGGRPSQNNAFPWFTVSYADRGLIAAVGWTGNWAMSLDRSAAGPTRLTAGMELTHLVLHPGERIRSPRILLMHFDGDQEAAHNRWRRLLLHHFVPQVDGRPMALPLASQCFDRYSWSVPEWATEKGQIGGVEAAHKLGLDSYWFDAAWFPGGFPNGVGNWSAKPKEFPNGLKPVTDVAHKYGMRFILWFEPERVADGTEIAREHPQFVLHSDDNAQPELGGLFNLGEPAARKWLTDRLSTLIGDFGIDMYRNDFNMDPLAYWRKADAPDRQGMAEIRYVEGLYEMWDELRARHPGLTIDNCSSGGRRIDLEMCMRSVPLWRSDISCSDHPEMCQTQAFGINQYVPLNCACTWAPDAYRCRSAMCGGMLAQFAYLDGKFPWDDGKAAVAEGFEARKFYYGDFYPLTGVSTSPSEFLAYQLDRPDLNAGMVVAYRRAESRLAGIIIGLKAIDPKATYEVTWSDDQRHRVTKRLPGSELASELELRVPKRPGSLLVLYRRV